MPLVDYSGSEDSDQEELPPIPEASKSKTTSNKPTFHKVVDRSNPHKIRVNLPEPSKNLRDDKNYDPEPPAKRAKIGSGGLSDFNALLPAPKKAATPNGSIAGGRKGGLGSGISLKTGATPGFSREAAPISNPSAADGEGTELEAAADGFGLSQSSAQEAPVLAPSVTTVHKPEGAPKKKGNSMMFKPLSVARKPPKKKPPPTDGLGGSSTQQPKQTPKLSLFSAGEEATEASSNNSTTNGDYQPTIYQPKLSTSTSSPQLPTADSESDHILPTSTDPSTPNTNQAPQSQSLDAIAADLNLSASAKRQLLGRSQKQKHNNPSQQQPQINIVNFNTDEEYAANELLRQAGEQVQHNPVRAIAPGKHSLKQLVNAASTQKDALEEQFAMGRRNKKEAGSKYGW